MNTSKKTAVGFSVGSAAFWMLASVVQYEALAAVGRNDFGTGSVVAPIIGVVPLVIYAVICLVVFRRFERKILATQGLPSTESEI